MNGPQLRRDPCAAKEDGVESKTAAQSVVRSRRHHSHRFSASVGLRSRLLRQRRGVPNGDFSTNVCGQQMAVGAEREVFAYPASLDVTYLGEVGGSDQSHLVVAAGSEQGAVWAKGNFIDIAAVLNATVTRGSTDEPRVSIVTRSDEQAGI